MHPPTNHPLTCMLTYKLATHALQIVRVDISAATPVFTDVVGEHDEDVLTFATVVHHDYLATVYTHDVRSVLQLRKAKVRVHGVGMCLVPT